MRSPFQGKHINDSMFINDFGSVMSVTSL